MKGRLLSVEEVNKLKTGDKVYIIPKVRICNFKDNVGLAMVKRGVGSTIKFYPAQGKDKKPFTTCNYISESPKSFLEVYEWIGQVNTNKNGNTIKENKQFLKSDLKTGHLVQTRNGLWWFVFRDMVNECFEDGMVRLTIGLTANRRNYMSFCSYNNDLTIGKQRANAEYDVIKVAKCKFATNFFLKPTDKSYVESLDGFEIIWQREEAPKNISPEDIRFTYTYNFETIKVRIKGKRVIVIDVSNNKGFANCHPDDAFNQNIGIEIAYWDMKRRIAEKKIEKYKN